MFAEFARFTVKTDTEIEGFMAMVAVLDDVNVEPGVIHHLDSGESGELGPAELEAEGQRP
jgi:hypothetical protein